MKTDRTAARDKLTKLRELMEGSGVDAYIVRDADPHLLEYAPKRYARRSFLSEFTGSNGTAVVTPTEALMWTDARYFIQAEKQLSSDWKLMKQDMPDVPTAKIGIDPFGFSQEVYKTLSEKFKAKEIQIVGLDHNLVDEVWGDQVPPNPSSPITLYPESVAGESAESKLKRIREEMEKAEVTLLFVAKLDEIGWTLNLRGADEPYTPIFLSYLIVTKDSAELFIDPVKVPEEVKTYLDKIGVVVKEYKDATEGLKGHIAAAPDSKIWLNPSLVNHAVFKAAQEAFGDKSKEFIVTKDTPLTLFMAMKNEVELQAMREVHVRDAVAIVEFLSWMEKEIEGGRVMTEVEVDIELTARRAKQSGFKGLSFPTIAGSNENGAIVHYRAEEGSCNTIDRDSMVLIDSGGQYEGGTTDITRTFHLGTPTDHQRDCFTRVLQGHIALATLIFPEHTGGIAIDAFARRPLWELGLGYMHGTGHGVGAHMCVHEGPIAVSFRSKSKMGQEGLQENMIISNEPGYYETGKFGIRIENLVILRKYETPFKIDSTKYLEMETISLVPIQKKLMNLEMMTPKEIKWMDEYHQQVWAKLEDKVSDQAKEWLREATAPLAA